MVDEKLIQLGTPISRFFPELPNGKHISIKDLLTHRINIMNYLPGGKFYSAIKSAYVFDELLQADTDVSPPEFSFIDPNYLVLGMIIENISGKSYQEVVEDRITGKIGLKNTFCISNGFINSFSAENEMSGKWDLSSLNGSGGIVSTPGDLGKFMDALFYHDLVSEKSLRTLLSAEDGLELGLNKFIVGNKTGYGYSGSMDGFYSQMIYFPSDSICISFSMNEKNTDTLDELVRLIYGS